jgi:HrpA-like RNA helicase
VEHREVEAMMVLPVYGAMSTKAQQQIFMRAPPGVRKVVVATDIASTSLTVDGVV